MNIKPRVYESLTPRQRVIATIEAEARDDDDEVRRLRNTCPKFTYRQTDAEYSQTMIRIVAFSLAVESDIRGNIIGALLAVMMDHDDALEKFLQNIANIRAAWDSVLEEMGIDPETMKKFAPPPHFANDFIYDLLPEPDERAVVEIAEGMREFLSLN
jgi:hypothetical protein